jgi:hypothetical protein
MKNPKLMSFVISDKASGKTVGYCGGPLSSGWCPQLQTDGSLPCDQRALRPMLGTWVNGNHFPPMAHAPGRCPLGWAIAKE